MLEKNKQNEDPIIMSNTRPVLEENKEELLTNFSNLQRQLAETLEDLASDSESTEILSLLRNHLQVVTDRMCEIRCRHPLKWTEEAHNFSIQNISWLAACLISLPPQKNKGVKKYIEDFCKLADAAQMKDYQGYLKDLLFDLKAKSTELTKTSSATATLSAWFYEEYMTPHGQLVPQFAIRECIDIWIEEQSIDRRISKLCSTSIHSWTLKTKDEEKSSGDILFSDQTFATEAKAEREIDKMRDLFQKKYGAIPSDGEPLFRLSFQGSRSEPPFQVGIYLNRYAALTKKSSDKLSNVLPKEIHLRIDFGWYRDTTRPHILLSRPLANSDAIMAAINIKSKAQTSNEFCFVEAHTQPDGTQTQVVAIDSTLLPESDADGNLIAKIGMLSLMGVTPPLDKEAKEHSTDMQSLFEWLQVSLGELCTDMRNHTKIKTAGFFPPTETILDDLDKTLRLRLINLYSIRFTTVLLVQRVTAFRRTSNGAIELADEKKHPAIYGIVRLLQGLQDFTNNNPHPTYQMVNNLLKEPLRGLPDCRVSNESIIRSLQALYT